MPAQLEAKKQNHVNHLGKRRSSTSVIQVCALVALIVLAVSAGQNRIDELRSGLINTNGVNGEPFPSICGPEDWGPGASQKTNAQPPQLTGTVTMGRCATRAPKLTAVSLMAGVAELGA